MKLEAGHVGWSVGDVIGNSMEKHASWLSYTASGSAVLFGFNLNDWGMLIGILIGMVTCAVNWYYKAHPRMPK